MRILQVARVYWPNIGGIEKHVQWLAETLVARGHHCEVLTLDRAFEDGRQLPAHEEHGGVRIRRIPYLGSKRYPLAPQLLAHLGGYDLVHVHAIDFLADWLVATRRLHGRPVVLSTHGGFFHTRFAPRLKKLWFATMTRRLLRKVDALIYTSDQDQELFSAITDRGIVLRNGVDLRVFGALRNQPVPGRWITVGRVDVHKGLGQLVRSLAAVKAQGRDFDAQVLGPEVVPGLVDGLRREAEALGVPIRFLGRVDDATLTEAVRTAELGLFPAEYESFGISVVEAMGGGVVPVLQDNRAFRYFVEGKSGFLTDYGDPTRAAATILRAADLGAERPAWSAAARAKALTYSWDAVIGEIEAVYASVLRGARLRA